MLCFVIEFKFLDFTVMIQEAWLQILNLKKDLFYFISFKVKSCYNCMYLNVFPCMCACATHAQSVQGCQKI